MAVQFIFARSGYGKTQFCISEIVDCLTDQSDSEPLTMLVPEQATYQTERSILSRKQIAGYHRLNVVSFNRLQLMLSGKDTAKTELSKVGRQMIVHRILRNNKQKLNILGKSADWLGLSRRLTDTIAELLRFSKLPEDIESLLSELQSNKQNNLAALKFADINIIFTEYLKTIENKYIDADLQLNQVCQRIAKADFFRGARLWVDGFSGFTTSELAILAELMKTACDTKIALCLDASKFDVENPDIKNIDPTDLFFPTQRTYCQLFEITCKCKLQLAQPVILDKPLRFTACLPLAYIEEQLFAPEPKKLKPADNIRLIRAVNPRDEIRFIARQIHSLVKEKKLRFRDIAVIIPDIEKYEHYVRAYFDDYGLPFFLDKPGQMNQRPLVVLLSSALRCLTGGFSSSDIFTYLKSGLVPVEKYSLDMLENYCVAFGITASDWLCEENWDFDDSKDLHFDQELVNQTKNLVITPLLELAEKICPTDNTSKKIGPDEFTEAVFQFLDKLGAVGEINDRTEQAAANNENEIVNEYLQFYDKFVDVFDELCEVFSGQSLTCADFLAILDSAFSQLTLAFIPPTIDQVLIGSIERSRHPDLKAVFLAGVTQKQFPSPLVSNRLITDDQRRLAENTGFQLAPAATQMLAERQYLAYIAFTRASEFLYVCYPAIDLDGKNAVRSDFVNEIERLFESPIEESIAPVRNDAENIHTETELAELLCEQAGLSGLLENICCDRQLAYIGKTVKAAINYDNSARLDADITKRLFGAKIKSSATKLGCFARCPYQHFARHILKLQERQEFKLRPLDLGRFYHNILDWLLRKLLADKKDWAATEDDKLLELLRNRISQYLKTEPFIANFYKHSRHNSFIIDSAIEKLEDCVLSIAQMIRAGSFRPYVSEVSFGQETENSWEFKLPLSENRLLYLSGKIDRIDIAEVNGRSVAVIFDYKKTSRSFNWSYFYYGLDLQLPLYILTSANCQKIQKTVGAFYIPIEIPPQKAELQELSKKAAQFPRKAKGIFDGEFAEMLEKGVSNAGKYYNFYVKDGLPYGNYHNRGALKPADFEKILKFTKKKITSLAEAISSGIIDIKPFKMANETPCSNCKYSPLCHFDWWFNSYNVLASYNKEQILEKAGGGNG